MYDVIVLVVMGHTQACALTQREFEAICRTGD